jgi:sec-independent protein translocase protein TatC
MNIFCHFNEFKIRFLYIFFCFCVTFLISYLYVDVFLFLVIKPLNTNFIFMNLFEGFYCFFIMSLFLSLFFIYFFSINSFFDFIKSGLTKSEKNVFLFIIKVEYLICLFSILFSYYFLLPRLVHFFLSFEQSKVENLFNFFFQARLLDYLVIFYSTFILSFFLFQIPFSIFLAINFNIVQKGFFIKFRREFIVFFFLIGCFFSPPDVYSQIFLAFPCIYFYEFIIFIVIFTENL